MYTPAPTPAVFSNGVPLDPKTLSLEADADALLAILNGVSGFPQGGQVKERQTENFATDGNKIIYNGDVRRIYDIMLGGFPLNVGQLIYSMGGIDAAGQFTCSGVGSPYNPVWVPAIPAAPAAQSPATVPNGWTLHEVGPGMFAWGPPSTPVVPAGTVMALTPEQASIITRMGVWLSKFGS